MRFMGYLLVFPVTLFVAGCTTMPQDTVTQFSTAATLERGGFQGSLTCADLARHGTLGAGYAEDLAATIVLLDGRSYAAGTDGRIRRAKAGTKLAQACAVPFLWDTSLNVASRSDHEVLRALVDKAVPNRNLLCAVKISGRFLELDICNPLRQSTSKRGLSAVLKESPRIRIQDAEGTLVGFRYPACLERAAEPGLVLFYLSSNLQMGGRAVACTMQEGTVEIDVCNQFHLIQPGTAGDEGGIVVVPKK